MATENANTPVFPSDAEIITAGEVSAGRRFGASAIYVGTGGDVWVRTIHDRLVVFRNVQSGSMLPVMCIAVLASNGSGDNTTASNFTRVF